MALTSCGPDRSDVKARQINVNCRASASTITVSRFVCSSTSPRKRTATVTLRRLDARQPKLPRSLGRDAERLNPLVAAKIPGRHESVARRVEKTAIEILRQERRTGLRPRLIVRTGELRPRLPLDGRRTRSPRASTSAVRRRQHLRGSSMFGSGSRQAVRHALPTKPTPTGLRGSNRDRLPSQAFDPSHRTRARTRAA